MMLVAFGVARERTIEQYSALLADAGLRRSRFIPTSTDHSLIKAVPVSHPS